MNRRLMMAQQRKEEIPRERLVFSNAGDVVAKGITKTNDGAAICGFAVLNTNGYYASSGHPNYWVYLILMTKSGRNDNAIKAGPWGNCFVRFTGFDGLVHSISSTTWDVPKYNNVQSGIDYINRVNINNLPIMNILTGKEYTATNTAGGMFSCQEAAEDLLDYYYGVI